MAEYVPELLNELTRIVLTTRNDNPSVQEYDQHVLPEWKKLQPIVSRRETTGAPPSVDEMQTVLRGVLFMLSVKHVPREEIRERVAEAFARARAGGLYEIDRAGVEDAAWARVDERLASLASSARAGALG